MKRRNTLKRRKMRGGKSLKRYVGGDGKGHMVFGHMSFEQILELAGENDSLFKKNGLYLAKCIHKKAEDGTLAFALIIIPINSNGQGSKIICFSSSDLRYRSYGFFQYLQSWPGDDETWEKFNDKNSPEVRCQQATETFLGKITSDDLLVTLLNEISSTNWSSKILTFEGDLSLLSAKLLATLKLTLEQVNKKLDTAETKLESSREDIMHALAAKERLRSELDEAQAQVQALESRVQAQAPVTEEAPQTSVEPTALTDQGRAQAPQAPVRVQDARSASASQQAHQQAMTPEELYFQFCENMLNLNLKQIKNISYLKISLKNSAKYPENAYEQIEDRVPYDSEIRFMWLYLLINFGLIKMIEMFHSEETDGTYLTRLMTEICTVAGWDKEYGLKYLKNEYYREQFPFVPISKNNSFTVEDKDTQTPIVKYMIENATKSTPTHVTLQKYEQKSSDEIEDMMNGFSQDPPDREGYSYVQINNNNTGYLYIFILTPNLISPSRLDDMDTLPQSYPHTGFTLIYISKKSEIKSFILPMYTRLLFWCSKEMTREELEDYKHRTKKEEERNLGRTKKEEERNLRRRYLSTQTQIDFSATGTPLYRGNLSFALEKRIEYAKKGVLADPLMPTDTSLEERYGLNNDGWDGETFKCCKIDSEYASVYVDGS